jgi:hypothetical protein
MTINTIQGGATYETKKIVSGTVQGLLRRRCRESTRTQDD